MSTTPVFGGNEEEYKRRVCAHGRHRNKLPLHPNKRFTQTGQCWEHPTEVFDGEYMKDHSRSVRQPSGLHLLG